MNLDTTLTVLTSVVSVAAMLAAVHSARTSARAERRASAAHGLAVRTAAVADLQDGLHRLRRLVRQADVSFASARTIASAMVDFEDRAQRHHAVMPTLLGAVDRQVRVAMGNCFGSPALVGWDPRLADREATTFDSYWWDITRTYLDHVDACLQDWRLAPTRRQAIELVPFHAWRRDEDASRFAPTFWLAPKSS